MNTREKIALLLFFIAVCATAPLVNHCLRLRRETTVNPSDLYEAVYSQITAFRASDFSGAYRQASSGIRQKFNFDQFVAMIRRDYAGIADAGRIEFGAVRSREQHALIQVFFIDRDGGVTPCIYSLIYEGENWRIDGARLIPRWPSGSRLGGLRS